MASGASLPDAARFGLAAAALNIEALGACHAVSGPEALRAALGRQAITPTT